MDLSKGSHATAEMGVIKTQLSPELERIELSHLRFESDKKLKFQTKWPSWGSVVFVNAFVFLFKKCLEQVYFAPVFQNGQKMYGIIESEWFKIIEDASLFLKEISQAISFKFSQKLPHF